MTVLAATRWPTNAEMIEACAELGYLRKEWATLDPTYGRGIWWKKWAPTRLVCTDRMTGTDFRALPFAAATFDAVTFDPPYVSVGGRATTGTPDLHDRYGLTDAPTSPAALQGYIGEGMEECARVLKPRGMLLVKCQDYISSGKFWPGTYLVQMEAQEILGLETVDRLEMITSPRPQPPGRRQVHARRNLSTLFVFRTPR